MIDPEHLSARAEPDWSALPHAVRFITAGVDVQGDRLEVEIVGWTTDEESWSIAYHRIEGNPAEDAVWIALDEYLKEKYEREDGKPVPISAVAIDTGGHHPANVANFCLPRQRRRIWAIKGANERKGTRLPQIWPRSVKTHRQGCPIHLISSQGLKDRIEMHLSKTNPGPGYMHLPASRDKTWYDQFLSEHRVHVDLGGGRMGSYWNKKPGKNRNEAWDCRVYALAALEGLRAKGLIPLRGAPGVAAPKPKPQVDENGEPVAAPEQPKRRRRVARKPSTAPAGW